MESIDRDSELYVQRHRIEKFFARLKDWRRVAMHYDQCPEAFLSACLLVAIVMFRL